MSRRGRQPTIRAKELAGPVSRKAVQMALEEGGQEAIGYHDGSGMIGRNLDKPEAAEYEVTSPWMRLRREYTKQEEKVLFVKAVMVGFET